MRHPLLFISILFLPTVASAARPAGVKPSLRGGYEQSTDTPNKRVENQKAWLSSQKPKPIEMERFTNARLGLEMQAPKDWREGNGKLLVTVNKSEKSGTVIVSFSDNVQSEITVSLYLDSFLKTIEDIDKNFERSLNFDLETQTLINMDAPIIPSMSNVIATDITVDGKHGRRYDLSGGLSAKRQFAFAYVIVGNHLYEFSFITPKERSDEITAVFNQLLASVRFSTPNISEKDYKTLDTLKKEVKAEQQKIRQDKVKKQTPRSTRRTSLTKIQSRTTRTLKK